MTKPSAHVALLRGINVGGKNKLPMAELARIFSKAGGLEVRTYIASGNVVFLASSASAKRIPALVSKRIEQEFGLSVPVVLRTADEICAAAANNPFLKSSKDMDPLYVGFLADLPKPVHVAALDPDRSPGDTFRVLGREIYMNLVTGAAKTKLTNAWFDSRLATISTFRNWRTLLKLCEITEELG